MNRMLSFADVHGLYSGRCRNPTPAPSLHTILFDTQRVDRLMTRAATYPDLNSHLPRMLSMSNNAVDVYIVPLSGGLLTTPFK